MCGSFGSGYGWLVGSMRGLRDCDKGYGMGWDYGESDKVELRRVWERGRFRRCTLVGSGVQERSREFVIDEYELQ
jgi:hypothetical protein